MRNQKFNRIQSPESDTYPAAGQIALKDAPSYPAPAEPGLVEFDLLKYWHTHRQWLLKPVLHR